VDGEERRGKLGSFAIGGIVGAGATLAALARRQRAARRRGRPRGLRAFESAPCYRELLDREREEAEAETVAGRE
jgi:hypothetical protein